MEGNENNVSEVIEETSIETAPQKTAKQWFWKDGLSIDETKLSSLILCLFGCMLFGGVSYIHVGDISTNLTTIITALIYAIAGVNITNSVLNRFNVGSSSQYTQTSVRPGTSQPTLTPTVQISAQAQVPSQPNRQI